MKFSIVTTAYNEEKNIPALLLRIHNVMNSFQNIVNNKNIHDYQFILVDNGSFDNTSEIITNICDEQKIPLKLVKLSRNFGYQGGLDAGLSNADGDYIFILDADLQDPPELLPLMYKKIIDDNLDLVYGIRKSRDESAFRKISFWLFYRIWKFFSNIPIILDSGDCCLMSKRLCTSLCAMPERIRFSRGLRSWLGFKHSGIEYHRQNRTLGETKFNFIGALNLAFDGIFSFSVIPIRLSFIFGLFIFLILFIYFLYFLIIKILNLNGFLPIINLPNGFITNYFLLLVLFSINFIFLGIIGEYIARIHEEIKNRPRFIIDYIKNYNI